MKRYSNILPKKDSRIALRLSEDKIAQYQYFAKKMNVHTSGFIRIACEMAMRYPDLFKEFKGFGYLPSLTVEQKNK